MEARVTMQNFIFFRYLLSSFSSSIDLKSPLLFRLGSSKNKTPFFCEKEELLLWLPTEGEIVPPEGEFLHESGL